MIRPVFFLSTLLILMVASCDRQMVYDHYMTTEEGAWGWHDVGVFEVDMADTVSLHNIYLQVRHTVEYPMSNLYMFVLVKGPSGQYMRDTVNMILAAPDGAWRGSGNGKIRELHLLYKKQTRFSESGIYTISLEQAMRKSKLPVTDVGVRIERLKQ
ncbi:MAG: gliding motility lipoprotein GldH [Bacteroidota bacterium]